MQISLDKSKNYLLACSYGPDSMTLFDILAKNGYSFAVAHVNYQMRGTESEKETRALKEYCFKHQIVYHEKYVDGKSYVGNFQNAARFTRYKFFLDLTNEFHYDALLTAHHNDDHLETYLMKTKSNRRTFYYGIKKVTNYEGMEVRRPLLNYAKQELLDYVKEHNIPYGIDASNSDPKYTRNRIRMQNVANLTAKERLLLNQEIEFKNKALAETEKKIRELIIRNTIKINDFMLLDEAEQEYLIYTLFSDIGIGEFYSLTKAQNLILIMKSAKTSFKKKLKDDIYIVKFEDKLTFINLQDYVPYEYVISKRQTMKTRHFTAFFADLQKVPFIDDKHFPLTITSPRKNDVYQIKHYKKALNRLFIDMKLPHHYRLIWPVVRNHSGEIIYIPRYKREYVKKATDLFEIYL